MKISNLAKFPILLSLFAFAATSCTKTIGECDTAVNCTADFTYIDLELKDTLGKPYILDSYTVTPASGGAAVISKTINAATDSTGHYIVMSDTEKSKVTKDGVYFDFVGKKGDSIVVSQPYRIAHDCCHVVIKSGLSIVVIK